MLPLPLQAQGIRIRPKRLSAAEIKRRRSLLSAAHEPCCTRDGTPTATAYESAYDYVSMGAPPRNEIERLVLWELREEELGLGTIEEGAPAAAHSAAEGAPAAAHSGAEGAPAAAHSGAEGAPAAAHSSAAEPRRRLGQKRVRGQVCLYAVSTCLQE